VTILSVGGHFSILHGSTLMPFAAMLVLVGASFAVRVPRLLRGDRHARGELGRLAFTTTRDWFPLVLILCVYGNFHDLTHILRPDTVDAALRGADEVVFGVEPSLAMQAITRPWLTEYMTFAYALFFVFPTILLVRSYARGDFLA